MNLLDILKPRNPPPLVDENHVTVRHDAFGRAWRKIIKEGRPFMEEISPPSLYRNKEKIRVRMMPGIRSGYAICHTCKKQKKQALEFPRSSRHTSGFMNVCKRCTAQYRREKRDQRKAAK